MSDLYQSLSHSKWDCKYHVVFVPKRRRRVLFVRLRRQWGPIFHALAQQKECQIVEGHLMPDHVHMCIAIPPKHPVASVIGFLKGRAPSRRLDSPAKSAISRASTFGLAAMRVPPWASNWSKSAATSATKRKRMEPDNSEKHSPRRATARRLNQLGNCL